MTARNKRHRQLLVITAVVLSITVGASFYSGFFVLSATSPWLATAVALGFVAGPAVLFVVFAYLRWVRTPLQTQLATTILIPMLREIFGAINYETRPSKTLDKPDLAPLFDTPIDGVDVLHRVETIVAPYKLRIQSLRLFGPGLFAAEQFTGFFVTIAAGDAPLPVPENIPWPAHVHDDRLYLAIATALPEIGKNPRKPPVMPDDIAAYRAGLAALCEFCGQSQPGKASTNSTS